MAIWDSLLGGGGSGGGGSGGGGSAMSGGMFSMLGSGVSDIFGGAAEGMKAKGDELQAQSYTSAAEFAGVEAQVSKSSTEVNKAQAIRQGYQGIGATTASVAGAGFSAGGSGGDILRSSAQQAALQAGVAVQTGQVATLGFEQQQKSYQDMAKASEMAAQAEKEAATGSYISGAIKIAGTVAMMA